MALVRKTDVDIECVEKGNFWSEYLSYSISSFRMSRIEISKVIVSFDVLIAMIHYTSYQRSMSMQSNLYQITGESAEIEMIPSVERYFYYTPNEKLEVVIDFFAHPETVEFA